MITAQIVRYCAEEVERQGRSPVHVADMVDAWLYAMGADWSDPLAVIQRCGQLIEPTKNDGGWRRCGVRVGRHIAPPAGEVPTRMARFAEMMTEMSPAEAYREYQMIHAFVDGNGRVGKIIFNHLNGSLASPILPPNFFGCVNL